MFTGQYSSENGMWRGPGQQPLGSAGYRGIKRDVKMLSEHLSESGYKTGAFGKWHLGSHEGEVPNDRGFDEFRGFLGGAHAYWIKTGKSKFMHNRQPDHTSQGHATELFTDWAEEFIRTNATKGDPFFCYLAYNAVHGPLRVDKSKPASAPETWIQKALDRGVSFLRSDYVAILEHMDHNIGRLVNLDVNVTQTLIVFVSDNGGCTMEENAAGGRFPGNNGPLRGGKASTYQGGLNVPLLINWKSRLPQGMVSNAQVMHCDLFSTIMNAANLAVPDMNGKNPVHGVSLIPHMLSTGTKDIPNRTMIFELWGNIGLRRGDHKLWSNIGREHSPDWDALVAELQQTDLALFDLSKDIAEKHDLRQELPEVYDSLKAELIAHFSGINTEYPGAKDLKIPLESAPAPPKKNATPAPQRRSPEQFFKARDRNSNGSIIWKNSSATRKVEMSCLTKRFNQMDEHDGKLLDEFGWESEFPTNCSPKLVASMRFTGRILDVGKTISRARYSRKHPEIRNGYAICVETRIATLNWNFHAGEYSYHSKSYHTNKSRSVLNRLILAVIMTTTCNATPLAINDTAPDPHRDSDCCPQAHPDLRESLP